MATIEGLDDGSIPVEGTEGPLSVGQFGIMVTKANITRVCAQISPEDKAYVELLDSRGLINTREFPKNMSMSAFGMCKLMGVDVTKLDENTIELLKGARRTFAFATRLTSDNAITAKSTLTLHGTTDVVDGDSLAG